MPKMSMAHATAVELSGMVPVWLTPSIGIAVLSLVTSPKWSPKTGRDEMMRLLSPLKESWCRNKSAWVYVDPSLVRSLEDGLVGVASMQIIPMRVARRAVELANQAAASPGGSTRQYVLNPRQRDEFGRVIGRTIRIVAVDRGMEAKRPILMMGKPTVVKLAPRRNW